MNDLNLIGRLVLLVVCMLLFGFYYIFSKQMFVHRRKQKLLLYLGMNEDEVCYLESKDNDIWELETPKGRMRAYFKPRKEHVIRVDVYE